LGPTRSTELLRRLCHSSHTIGAAPAAAAPSASAAAAALRKPASTLQLHELSSSVLDGADLRALAAVPTLTALRLMVDASDLQPEQLTALSPELRSLSWDITGPSLPVAQTLQAFRALGLSRLTALSFYDERLSEEELTQLLTPLTQLAELKLLNHEVRSAAFLQSGSLPRTLRTLRLWANIPAAQLEEHLPSLRALTVLVLNPGAFGFALGPLAERLRVPSALLPQLQSFSSDGKDWDGPPQDSPFDWD